MRKLISVQTAGLLSDLGENSFKRSEHNVSRICEFCESRHREDHTFLRVYMNLHSCVYREVYGTEKVNNVLTKSMCCGTDHIIYNLVYINKRNDDNTQVVMCNFDGERSVARTEYMILFLHRGVYFKQNCLFCSDGLS